MGIKDAAFIATEETPGHAPKFVMMFDGCLVAVKNIDADAIWRDNTLIHRGEKEYLHDGAELLFAIEVDGQTELFPMVFNFINS